MKGGQRSSGWAWNGIIGSGQSLAVGASAGDARTVLGVHQPYGHLKLSLGRAQVPPWDADPAELSMVPLVEPIRTLATEYPSSYPGNIYGETPHTAMANQISALAAGDDTARAHVTVHSVVGEGGQGMVSLTRQAGSTTGVNGRAYAAALFEVHAIASLAQSARKTYGVRAVVMTHGETDWESRTYRDELVGLLADWNRDLRALTGQAEPIVMFLSQQFAFPTGPGERPTATQTQWRLGVERPGEFVCTGPKYQYEGEGDGIHLTARSYQALGEKTGQVYFERFLRDRDWQPLHPILARRDGSTVVVRFHVPVPPLDWDLSMPEPVAWRGGRGFELFHEGGRTEIESVVIEGDSVRITPQGPLPSRTLSVGYAMTSGGAAMPGGSGSSRWGMLRDSDPLVGATTGMKQPNYAVSFELAVE